MNTSGYCIVTIFQVRQSHTTPFEREPDPLEKSHGDWRGSPNVVVLRPSLGRLLHLLASGVICHEAPNDGGARALTALV